MQMEETKQQLKIPKIVWTRVNPSDRGLCGPLYIEGRVGKWKIFSIHRSTLSRDGKYNLVCRLPGIKENPGEHITDESDLMVYAEKILKHWFVNLVQNPNEQGE